MSAHSFTAEETYYYQLSGGDQRKVIRAALKRWREQHPELLPAISVHDGYYGWVLRRSSAEETRIVARVMDDCIIPYLQSLKG